MDLAASLLEISLLLVGAAFVGILAQRVGIPVTVVLAIGGFLVAWAGGDKTLELVSSLRGEAFKETLIYIFLPALVFAAALELSTRDFLRNLVPILVLATIALAIAAALVGVALRFGLDIPLAAALLFGVLISATDPTAVIAVFRDVGVPRRLLTLVEGESLLNDGVAIVGFNVLLLAALGENVSIGAGIIDFSSVFFGGALIGAVIGLGAALALPLLDRYSTVAMSMGIAYGSFVTADAIFGFSGVMATVTAGLVMGGLIPSRADAPIRQLLTNFWDAISYIANALLFLFIGLLIDPASIGNNLGAIALAIVTVLIARPLAVVPVVFLLDRFTRIRNVGGRNAGVLVWGGLRGGVALALALSIPATLPENELFVAMTGGVVLTTLLVNATTISTLVHRLGLDRPSHAELFLGASARLHAIEAAREELTDLALNDNIVDARLSVAKMEAIDQLERIHLSPIEELDVYTMRGLYVERQVYQTLSDAKLLRPIATRTLMQEIDNEIDEMAFRELAADAPRREERPWYAQAVRQLLGWLPEPAGEDLTEVGYSEVSARRLAAHRAALELDIFKTLPNCDPTLVDKAKETFGHWEAAATELLGELGLADDLDHRTLMRHHAEALTRVASVESVIELIETGLISKQVGDRVVEKVCREVNRGHD